MRLSAFEIMERLVGFPTVSRDSNLALADWVEEYLQSQGIETFRMPNEDGTKAAIYAHVGPAIDGGVVLSGHTDVVPVDGQDWTVDPWKVTRKDDRFYGRGTCDMKGFDALAIAALVEAKSRGNALARPIQIALSYDEEVGCTGAPPLIEAMAERLPKASVALIGEPSMMQVVTGHKGGAGFDIHIRGFEVHSSIMHTGVNAIMEGARLIEWANLRNAENMKSEPSEMAAIFDPPWTTLHVGKIAGGTAHNITARDCRFAVDFRFVPSDDAHAWIERLTSEVLRIEENMKAIRPEASIDMSPYFKVPGLRPENNGEAEMLARGLTGDNGNHVVSYGTEAGHFQDAGYSSVICGPGDIAQAHQPDEYILATQFQAGEDFMLRLVDRLCA